MFRQSKWPAEGDTRPHAFMSTSVQFCVAQAFSRISKMATVLRFMMSTSHWPMESPARLNLAASSCSSDHWGSLLASSWRDQQQSLSSHRFKKPPISMTAGLRAHLEEHLHLQWAEAVPLFDSWVSLQKRPSGHPATHPLNGNHLTVGSDERGLRMLLHKGRLNPCKRGQTVKMLNLSASHGSDLRNACSPGPS